MLRGELDLALITSAEALATQRAYKKRGERYPVLVQARREAPVPVGVAARSGRGRARGLPGVAHVRGLRQRAPARLGLGLDEYRAEIGEMLAPMTAVAAANPHAWYPVERTADEIVDRAPRQPHGRLPVYEVLGRGDGRRHGGRADRRHPRARRRARRAATSGASISAAGATRPIRCSSPSIPTCARSPAMAAASAATRSRPRRRDRRRRVPRPLLVLRELAALRVRRARHRADDPRGLTVTGGLPYHGGPASGYLTHSIAAMVERLRADPGALGLVSGVGMHMTKHVFGCYSTTPGRARTARAAWRPAPIERGRSSPSTKATRPSRAYSVVHGRDGTPEWALLVCDLAGRRAHVRAVTTMPTPCAAAEREELVGTQVRLEPRMNRGPMGDAMVNHAIW